jgi:hypothetical protein
VFRGLGTNDAPRGFESRVSVASEYRQMVGQVVAFPTREVREADAVRAVDLTAVDAAGARRRGDRVKCRAFITFLGGVAAAWPLAVRGQQAAMPVIGYLGADRAGVDADLVVALRDGLKESGFVEGHTWQSNIVGRKGRA